VTSKILVVCTANRCRSPIAAAILAQEAARRGLEVQVDSVGLLPGGQPVPPDGLRRAAELGLDLRSHRSRTVQRADLTGADLVVTMSREHARTLVAQEPSVWPRIFTLKQLPRWLGERLAEEPPPRRADLRSWLESVGADRDRRELLGRQSSDDVRDPFNESVEVWNRVVREIRDLCLATLDLSVPLLRPLVPR
jgi:protein-tyrosine phosphatase